MPNKCAVLNCKNNRRKLSNNENSLTKDAVTFFDFPSSPNRKKIWLENIGRPNWKVPKSAYICSKHFNETDLIIILNEDVVPLKQDLQTLSSSKRLTRSMIASLKDNNIEKLNDAPNSPKSTTVSRTPLKKKDIEKLDSVDSKISTSLNSEKRKRDESMDSSGRITRRRQTIIDARDFRLKQIKISKETVGNCMFKTPTTAVLKPTTAASPKCVLSISNEVITAGSSLKKSRTLRRVNTTNKNDNLSAAASLKSNRSVPIPVSTDKKSLNKPAPTSSKTTRHITNGKDNKSNGQLHITNFFIPSGGSSQEYKESDELSSIEDTIFGWATIGIEYIPYIICQSEKYCSMRMIEKTKSANLRTKSSRTCNPSFEYFRPTENQCRLLTEINREHCDAAYGGRFKFTTKDLLVRLTDAQKFYFEEICDEVRSTGGVKFEFGFTLINKKSYIPYTILEGEKFVPLFYLKCDESVLNILKTKAYSLPANSELSLKFCCHYDGVSTDIFDKQPLEVINFDDIKELSPPKTDYKDCWPTQESDYQLKVVQMTKGLRLKHVQKLPK